MKRLILTASLAIGLLAACGPGATPSVRVVTPEPSIPSASGLPTSGASPAASNPLVSPSRTP